MRSPVTRSQMDKIEDDFVNAIDNQHLGIIQLQFLMKDFHRMVELERALSKHAIAQLGREVNRKTIKEQA